MKQTYPRIAALVALVAGLLLAPIPAAQAVAPTLPTAPTSITATAGPASIDLTWAAPAYPGSGVSAYSVEYATSTDTTTWTMASNTISNSATSYTITPLTSGVNYFVRMAALNSGTPGPFGYPWTRIYSTATGKRNGSGGIDYDANYGLAVGDTATVLSNAGTTFTRVKYRLEYNSGGTVYADADMAKWDTSTLTNNSRTYPSSAATITNLRIPSTNAGNTFQIQTNVQDLTVVSSISGLNVSNKVGRLELWPWNYGQGLSGLSPPGISDTYDYDDFPTLDAAYGSFQVHNATDGTTIFAWNNHASNTPDLGIGNGPSNPDWTFAYNFNSFTNFHLYIYINIPTMPTTPLSSSVTIATPATTTFRSPTTLTAATSTTGKVTFFSNGKRIPGCVSIRTVTNTGVTPNTYSATCPWKPATRGAISLSATFTPTAGPISTFKLSTPSITGNRTSKR